VLTLGSLFDGIGVFPLAATLNGIELHRATLAFGTLLPRERWRKWHELCGDGLAAV